VNALTKLLLATLVVLGAACADDEATALRVTVGYQPEWGLTALDLTIGDESRRLEMRSDVLVLVPDDWAGEARIVEVVGLLGDTPYAAGSTAAVPVRGEEIPVAVQLSREACSQPCTPGTTRCEGDAITTCEERASRCSGWSTPIACEEDEACTGGSCVPDLDGGDDEEDANIEAADAAPVECHPVSQAGCGPGEKCAFIVDDVGLLSGHFGCAADGTAGVGEGCTAPAAVGESDDCEAGAHCYEETCHAICEEDATCGDRACVPSDTLDFGLCLPGCNLLTQNCPVGQGCYLATGEPICAAVTETASPPGGVCMFINDCAAGGGCFEDGMGGGVCLAYCDATAFPCCGDACGGTPGCEADEVCVVIEGEESFGVCLLDADAGCVCTPAPVCDPG
jgi:hypothetical protein